MTAALEFLAALSALVLTISYRIENRRRDRLYGVPDPLAPVDTTELADKVRVSCLWATCWRVLRGGVVRRHRTSAIPRNTWQMARTLLILDSLRIVVRAMQVGYVVGACGFSLENIGLPDGCTLCLGREHHVGLLLSG